MTCPACRLRAYVARATFTPAAATPDNDWDKLQDGQIVAIYNQTTGYGALTDNTSNTSTLVLQLDGFYDDILGVVVFPYDDSLSTLAYSGGLTAFLSTIANYTIDTNATQCGSAQRTLIERTPLLLPCSIPAVANMSFVTLTRTAAGPAPLGLMEVKVMRAAGASFLVGMV